MTDVDPIQLEIIRNALVAASEQMSVTIWRTSRSTVIREMLDYSTAIFSVANRIGTGSLTFRFSLTAIP